jgi:hypothetical protein
MTPKEIATTAAAEANFPSPSTAERASRVFASGDLEIQARVNSGEISISWADKILRNRKKADTAPEEKVAEPVVPEEVTEEHESVHEQVHKHWHQEVEQQISSVEEELIEAQKSLSDANTRLSNVRKKVDYFHETYGSSAATLRKISALVCGRPVTNQELISALKELVSDAKDLSKVEQILLEIREKQE